MLRSKKNCLRVSITIVKNTARVAEGRKKEESRRTMERSEMVFSGFEFHTHLL